MRLIHRAAYAATFGLLLLGGCTVNTAGPTPAPVVVERPAPPAAAVVVSPGRY